MARLASRSIRIHTDYSLSRKEWVRHEERQLEDAAEAARATAEGDLVGEIIRFAAADGHAVYMVTSQRPLVVTHVEVGDAYQVHGATIRGLRIQDVRAQVEADRRRAAAQGAARGSRGCPDSPGCHSRRSAGCSFPSP